MKKILFLPIAVCLLVFSCSKDENPANPENAPDITSFSPTEGPVGTSIWITGKNFGSTVADNTVKIGNTIATVTSAKETEIFITVPEGATTGAISVTVDGKTDTAGTFTVIESTDHAGISLNKSIVELFTLDSETLTVSITGDVNVEDIVWSSDDESIAIVDDNGKITGVAEGSAHVTAFISEEVSTNCIVRVSPSVFAVGYEEVNGTSVAKFWKNGVATNLTDNTKFGGATSVFVDGTDIYISGIEENDNELPSAKVWKNGELLYTLSDPSNYGNANSIYVYDGDVYVAGSETDENEIATAKIWKNGETYASLTNGGVGSQAYGISVNETGIYTAGYEESEQQENGTPKLWRDMVQEDLTEGLYHGQAQALYANGSDVYVAGYEEGENENSVAKIWINGQVIDLDVMDSEAHSIFVKEEDVYVAGIVYGNTEDEDQAVVWKNASPTEYGIGSAASSVYIYDGDVYVGGSVYEAETSKAITWKNAEPIALELTEGAEESAVLSVFVK